MLAGSAEDAARCFDMGFTFVAAGSDLGIMTQGAATRAAALRKHLASRTAPLPAGRNGSAERMDRVD
jgi:hypothetical protein